MSTDNPFKQLFSDFIMDFATWLLGDNIRQVSPLNIALPPGEEIRPDLEGVLKEYCMINFGTPLIEDFKIHKQSIYYI